jgi:hypothetical protein
MVEVGERLEFGSEMGQAAPLSRLPATVLLEAGGWPVVGGMVRGPHRERRARARALGRPLSRRAGRVGVTAPGPGSLPQLGPWRPSFVAANPVPGAVTCAGSGWSLFVSSLAYTGP